MIVLVALMGCLRAATPVSSVAASVAVARDIQLATRNPEPGTNTHWSFKPRERPPVPKVKNQKWVRNPIDAFVLSRLERQPIKPSPEADRRTLIRRLSFDLLGLPPAPEDVSAFIKDQRADAYDQLVDRLLASPHFGEHWGRHWLDLARYADSDGYEKDSVRPYAYLFRDWVIEAINRDLPFDEFTIEQLAGDLLPNATPEQKIATGFHRNTLTNKEGGVDQEEFRCKAVVDRVNTTGAVWLGLTVGCAECHSHKYDPISHQEYYQLYAFFNNANEADVPAPQKAELASYNHAHAQWEAESTRLKKSLAVHLQKDFDAAQTRWEDAHPSSPTHWQTLQPENVSAAEGTALKVETDQSISATGKSPVTDSYTVTVDTPLQNITALRLEVLVADSIKSSGRAKNGNFVLSEFTVKTVSPTAETKTVPLTNAVADFSQKNYSVAESIDGNAKSGWAVAPQTFEPHVAVFETVEPLSPAGKLVVTLSQQFGKEYTLARFRLSATTSAPPFHIDVIPAVVAKSLETAPNQRDAIQKAELTKYYREEIDPVTLELKKQIAAQARKEPKFPETKAMTLAAADPPRTTQIHIRGDFLRKGDEVEPGTPRVLHRLMLGTEGDRGAHATRVSPEAARHGAAGEPDRAGNSGEPPDSTRPRRVLPNRLDLARWLFDPANPLTARVSVNRVWQHLFGRALVTTPADFGTRGDKPSHPELLDWLSTEFPRLGWSRKTLIKLIVSSSTYRQASAHRSDLVDRDPNNVLLGRQNRFRLEAENVRDTYLAASGLLNPVVGGPSVRPPLPADIAAIGYANSIKWKESEGVDRYRRGLYIFFQRTVPYPMLVTFDAPDSNVTCPRRERSNTPLQALTLLNDPVFFECAQALGKRLAAEPANDITDKLRRAFVLCLSRDPGKEELARLARLYADQFRAVQKTPDNAAKIIGSAKSSGSEPLETAALIAVARTLMNLDEFVTRE
jgi:hypothetical protein